MAVITAALLNALRQTLSHLFKKGLGNCKGEWEEIATRVPSSSQGNTYGWLSAFPQLRKWIGERVFKDLKENAYTLPNETYEASIEVSRDDIEDDVHGMYGAVAESMGQECVAHVNRNVFSLLKKGFQRLCYDGQNFFDTEHPVYPNTDGTGEAQGVSNILNPEVTNKPPWYLIDNSRPLKPLIFQERTKPELEGITDPKQDTVFRRNVYLFGIRVRRAFGYGFWQMAIASRDSLNEQNFDKAYAMMQSFKADGGDPLGCTPRLLVVGPALRSRAVELIEVMNKANGASNPNYRAVKVIVSPYLA